MKHQVVVRVQTYFHGEGATMTEAVASAETAFRLSQQKLAINQLQSDTETAKIIRHRISREREG